MGLISLARQFSRRASPIMWPYLFLSPAMVALGLVFIYPLVSVCRSSFFSNGIDGTSFAGLGNYRSILGDHVFVTSFFNSLKLLLTVPITTGLALGIALMLYEGTKGWRLYRVIIFVPYIIPATAVGIGFSYLLQKNGILNVVLQDLKIGFFAHDWIGNSKIVLFSIGAVLIWTQLGFGVVVFTASLLSLPKELTEAATVDGASRWQRNRFVIVPQVRTTIEFFLVVQAIQVIAWTFPYVYVITHGGPGNASSVMDLYVWQYAFQYNSTGMSSAASVVLLAMASLLIVIYSRLRIKQSEI